MVKTEFTSSDLKLLAMASMAAAHGAVVWQNGIGRFEQPIFRGLIFLASFLGRAAFPLYGFLLVEGFLYTRNRIQYGKRLGILALASEIPFNLAINGTIFWPDVQNTLFLLFFGLIAMEGVSRLKIGAAAKGSSGEEPGIWLGSGAAAKGLSGEESGIWLGSGAVVQGSSGEESGIRLGSRAAANHVSNAETGFLKGKAFGLLMTAAAFLAAHLLRADYGAAGLFFLLVLYWFRNDPPKRMAVGCAVLLVVYWQDLAGFAAWIAFFFINRYNGEKGRSLGWFPYAFYPIHLLLLYGAGVWIYGINF